MKLHILDTHFQGMPQVTAVYLLIGPDGPVLVESGPGSTLPAVLDALAGHGFAPADVRAVLLTHIHLDHAGAAGWWAQQGAQLYVHHVGAPHLIDPTKLLASATRIYGDNMGPLWGEMVAAPAERVTAVYDGDTIAAGGLTFTAVDTPGHAYHHHAYRLSDGHGGAILFTGDAAGVSLPHIGVVDLPAPPPEFHLETWLGTLARLEQVDAHTFYPTHYGPVTDVHGHLTALRTVMIDAVAFVAERAHAGAEREQLLADYIGWNRERAAALHLSPTIIRSYELANPLFMSVDGILRYLRKRGAV
ncbi:Metallo-beta-lactamase [Candidatus Promineifilum breve]|uniref:Metallo-beta-lactamase n=1 Tax=Candidatus Promineifilum breve TaxID=1806508 RepID=A0A160T781_9CHLR|nr:MBL fold metallo-hydrolase [Candidatus Promineifilum breve]CUS06296.1 Metallo-beta-lactamase [Candidatus Promineifilum breve]